MKIRIIGPCGSGKSTAARELSRLLQLPCYEIDNIVWDRSAEKLKFPEEVRNRTFREILDSEDWILEGVQHGWTKESFLRADWVVVMHPHVLVRDYRIIRRFIRSRTGLEEWNYKQSFSNLVKMVVKWNHGYDAERILKLTAEAGENRIVVTGLQELVNWAAGLERGEGHNGNYHDGCA